MEALKTLRLEDGNGDGDVELENALTAHAPLEKPTRSPAICRKKTGKYDL